MDAANQKEMCSKCGELKPKNRFNDASTQCRDCRTEYQRQYRKSKPPGGEKPPESGEKRKPGRPPSGPELPPMPPKPAGEPRTQPAFEDRKTLEDYIKAEMANNLTQYDAIIESAERMLQWAEQHGAVKEAVKQQGVIRQTLKDKQAMIANLTKQFELLSNLDKPPSEDPKYTPVLLELHLDPPAKAMVEKRHYLDPEDIQDGQDIS